MRIDFSHAALLEIDVQNDFCPEYTGPSGRSYPPGALAVPDGQGVIPPLNALAVRCADAGAPVIATADWHPPGHVSFITSGNGEDGAAAGVWPEHCRAGTIGAAFHEELDIKPLRLIIHKGFRRRLDSYSAFFENDRITPTGLQGFLAGLGVRTLLLGGLATDYCILYSALDGRRLGYETLVLSDAVRGVDYPAGSTAAAWEQMEKAGIRFARSEDLA